MTNQALYRLITSIGIIIGILMFFSLAGSLYKSYEISTYKSEIKSDIVNLENENDRMAELLQYLSSDHYFEKKAKESLGKKWPDEIVVILPDDQTRKNIRNPRKLEVNFPDMTVSDKWLFYFFGE